MRNLQRKKRKGIAALEMVIFLPCLIILAMILIFMCGFGINTSKTIVEARHDAWSKRYVDRNERDWKSIPFFLKGNEDQYAKGESEKKVKLIKLFSNWTKPSSRHLVLAGTWDHEEDLLDRSPNIMTAINVGKYYVASVLTKAEGDIKSVVSAFNNMTDPQTLIRNAANAMGNELKNMDPSKILNPF